jgi:hypothetical protein
MLATQRVAPNSPQWFNTVNGFHVAAAAGPESYEAGLFQEKSSVFQAPRWMIRRSRRLFFVISSPAGYVT